MTDASDPLAALADHLAGRRDAILAAWRKAVLDDPLVTASDALPWAQLEDHIPAVLWTYEEALRAGAIPRVCAGQMVLTVGHGLHRWQQGYSLREVVREWGHLHVCVLDEVDGFAATTGAAHEAMAAARRYLACLVRDGVAKSAAEYFDLHRTEAAGRAKDLEAALAQLRTLERTRAESLREAAHDLRGSLGVAASAAAGLAFEGLPDSDRAKFAGLLQKGLAALKVLLNDLMDLARLEAGHDRLRVEPFDAAAVLAELCEASRPLAVERGLTLTCEGPAALPVEGDAVKVRRVAQNLVLNALKYTRQGGVAVRWEEGPPGDRRRWVLTVRDTGPGLRTGSAAPMAAALEAATGAANGHLPAGDPPPATTPRGAEVGEGIGLAIVKRLCELLDATLELESEPGAGSTFRVRFPHHYPAAPRPAAG
jgi:signal transduction histidine kinase